MARIGAPAYLWPMKFVIRQFADLDAASPPLNEALYDTESKRDARIAARASAERTFHAPRFTLDCEATDLHEEWRQRGGVWGIVSAQRT